MTLEFETFCACSREAYAMLLDLLVFDLLAPQ